MSTVKIDLHPGQMAVFKDKHRFKVVAAGRRWGKSRMAATVLIYQALQSTAKDVWYIAPTFQQARDIMWNVLVELSLEVAKTVNISTSTITLVNGRSITLKGSDRPDTMRGVGLAYVVIDEYADMKPNVWEEILRPALADVKGGALFIGTPKGRNHFWELYKKGVINDPEWKSWHFVSTDNPFLDPLEVAAAKESMSSAAYRQEFEASFEQGGADLFKREWVLYETDEPKDGDWYVAVDLAGFEDVASANSAKQRRLDRSAIAVVKVNSSGWWVKEIRYGRWDVRRTSIEILKAAKDVGARRIGIEKGALRNAVLPYLDDQRRRLGYHPVIEALTHGAKAKTDRVMWALQGRFEHGRIKLNEGTWNKDFEDELINFPSRYVHDDLVDALSYIDQMATVIYLDEDDMKQDYYDPIDPDTGI
jgi:hypothetical protein